MSSNSFTQKIAAARRPDLRRRRHSRLMHGHVHYRIYLLRSPEARGAPSRRVSSKRGRAPSTQSARHNKRRVGRLECATRRREQRQRPGRRRGKRERDSWRKRGRAHIAVRVGRTAAANIEGRAVEVVRRAERPSDVCAAARPTSISSTQNFGELGAVACGVGEISGRVGRALTAEYLRHLALADAQA